MPEETTTEAPKTEESKAKTSSGLPKWLIFVIATGILFFVVTRVFGFITAKFAGKAVETAIEKQTEAKIDVDKNGGSIKVKSEDGNLEIGNTTKWPEDIPAGIPKLSAGTIMGAVKTDKSWSVIIKDIEGSDVESYISELKKLGWETLVESTSTTISATQMEKENLQIALTYDSSSKNLNLMIAYKE